MGDLGRLVDLQDLDNRIGAARHRLTVLPERAELTARQTELATLDAAIAAADAPLRALEGDQRRLEDEVATLRTKITREDARLYDGTVTALKELQAIQDEIASLRRRVDTLEDRLLDLLVEIEPLQATAADRATSRTGLLAAVAAAEEALAAAEQAGRADLAALEAERPGLVDAVGADGVDRYERLRPAFAPATVVRLVGARCEGCPSAMPAVEVDRLRHLPSGLDECEECGRLVLH